MFNVILFDSTKKDYYLCCSYKVHDRESAIVEAKKDYPSYTVISVIKVYKSFLK